jgi:hypothetical protein
MPTIINYKCSIPPNKRPASRVVYVARMSRNGPFRIHVGRDDDLLWNQKVVVGGPLKPTRVVTVVVALV